MAKSRAPVSAAVRVLRANKAEFSDHLYEYEEHGGTAVSARELGVPEHAVIKTLIMEDETANPIVVLMHGDRKVSTRALARALAVKSISACSPETVGKSSVSRTSGRRPTEYGKFCSRILRDGSSSRIRPYRCHDSFDDIEGVGLATGWPFSLGGENESLKGI